MAITVKLFANFREAAGKNQIEIQADDIKTLLDKLAKIGGEKLTEQLYTKNGKLRDTVHILVNGRGINLLKGLNTRLKDGDTVAIFPPVSGGGLTSDELRRYSRQISIPGFGKKGQLKLKRAHVFVAGLGGLGSPSSVYLIAAGIGHLTIIDEQRVDMTNLNRQILHWELDVGRSKAASAVEKLYGMNPNVKVDSKLQKITLKNVDELIEGADVIVDGTDNYPTRYLLNEACVRNRIPFVHGAVEGMVGQMMTIVPRKGPCLRCLVPQEPPKKPLFPVLGATPGVIGCLQAMETIKLITGVGEPLVGRLLIFNGNDMTFSEIKIKRNPRCPVCGGRRR
jgi:adenylyltransferase/sulfurtransferase